MSDASLWSSNGLAMASNRRGAAPFSARPRALRPRRLPTSATSACRRRPGTRARRCARQSLASSKAWARKVSEKVAAARVRARLASHGLSLRPLRPHLWRRDQRIGRLLRKSPLRPPVHVLARPAHHQSRRHRGPHRTQASRGRRRARSGQRPHRPHQRLTPLRQLPPRRRRARRTSGSISCRCSTEPTAIA